MKSRFMVAAALLLVCCLATPTFAAIPGFGTGELELVWDLRADTAYTGKIVDFNQGGEFAITYFDGVDIADMIAPAKLDVGLFQTFCVEISGSIAMNKRFWYEVSTQIETRVNAVWTYTDLPPEVAYLYTRFWEGNLAGYNYSPLGKDEDQRGASARDLQGAIWAHLGFLPYADLPTQRSKDWYDQAANAVATGAWKGIGNVRVLNLREDNGSETGKNRQDILVIIDTFTPGHDCCADGKPVALTFKYTGEGCDASNHTQDPKKVDCSGDPNGQDPAYIIVSNDTSFGSGHILFEGSVGLGETFTASAANTSADKFNSDTYVKIYDSQGGTKLQYLRFHTSCSQPLFTGDQFGSLLLVGCEGEDGGPCGGSCETGGKPVVLTVRYTGEDCSASNHSQDDGKVTCSGDPDDADPVWIIVNSHEHYYKGLKYFEGEVALNGTFNIDARAAGLDRLKGETYVHIYASQSDVGVSDPLQKVGFHTSCSQPLGIDDQFGSILIVDYHGEKSCQDLPNPPPNSNLCTVRGKPIVLTMTYTGKAADNLVHDQDAGKVSVVGSPDDTDPVYIIASDKQDLCSSKANIWFKGSVALGAEFQIDARPEGEDKLASETWVHIFASQSDAEDALEKCSQCDSSKVNPLQLIKFHTSCSQPLRFDDEFGGIKLTGFCGQNCPTQPPLPPSTNICKALGKPVLILAQYTGEDDTNLSHDQDDGKVYVDGDPNDADPVWIVVKSKSGKHGHGKHKKKKGKGKTETYFEGEVSLDGFFRIDARVAGDDRLASETCVYIYTEENGTLLQTVKFHTSCSQPLALGDEFGAVKIAEYYGEESPDTPAPTQTLKTNFCDIGKPAALALTYTMDNLPLNTAQKPGKYAIFGDPSGDADVYIIANDESDPTKGNQWFEGQVKAPFLDFEIKASAAGENKLSTETWIHIYSEKGGTLLQKVKFHTSCSQPIRLNDQYGAIKIAGFTPE